MCTLISAWLAEIAPHVAEESILKFAKGGRPKFRRLWCGIYSFEVELWVCLPTILELVDIIR